MEIDPDTLRCPRGHERPEILAHDACYKCEDERGWRILLGIMAPGMALFVVVSLWAMWQEIGWWTAVVVAAGTWMGLNHERVVNGTESIGGFVMDTAQRMKQRQ